ncbi:hypothetical protein GN958_ATG20569 [Phytophthora infestans]|uniref:Uncharacterized protein n=1 Tax=Phytophthora infestans TaxID=4787 RepID=A0A8S9TUE3_PHYIN|nr:hypothetical protein GN958_ATG20569 [Phytophthora infestans]
MHCRLLFLLLTAITLVLCVDAVDRSKLRTCQQSQFCNKYRNAQREELPSKFRVARNSIWPDLDADLVRFLVEDAAKRDGIPLAGSLAFVLNEDKAAVPALQTRPLRQLTAQEAGLKRPINEKEVLLFSPETQGSSQVVAALKLGSFGVDLFLNGELVVSTNDDGLFHYEVRHNRADAAAQTRAAADQAVVDAHEGKTIVDYGEDGLAIYADGSVQKKKEHQATMTATVGVDGNVEGWKESFGGHTDKEKFGPSSIGLDVSFHG